MASRTPPNPNEIAVITVHGTGDTAKTADGDKWFQNGSKFTGLLKDRLAKQGIQATIVPHLWTGENSASDRENGARKLRKAIKEHAKHFGGVHVIGHSHGGNVADEAAAMLDWKLHHKRPPQLSGVTTVGTPFFKNQVGTWQAFGGIAFLTILILTIVGLALTTPVILLLLPEYARQCARDLQQIAELTRLGEAEHAAQIAALRADLKEGEQFISFFKPLTWLIAISAGALFFILPLAIQGSGRVRRAMRKQNKSAAFFSIWHPHDEAISFLQRVEELPIEPFPRWTLWRSSRTSAVVWGVWAVLATFLLAIAVAVGGMIGVEITNDNYETLGRVLHFNGRAVFGDMSTLEFGIFLFIATILGAPLFFGGAWLLTRLIAGLGLEILGRGWLNNSVAGILRGMAFGSDGDERIGKVATQSHNFGVRPYLIDGELAERMRGGAATAAATLIEKYRWSLFTVGPDTTNAVNQIAKDAMTWDSLIHTTYFDQPEIAAMIADYIAECVERDKAALAARSSS